MHKTPIYLPAAKKLSDLFKEVLPYNPNERGHWNGAQNCGLIYCHTSGKTNYNSFHVMPTQAVCEIVGAAQKVVEDENMYFSLVFRDDDTVLVIAQYNQIIGSRWLCVLPVSEFASLMK
jgi:hypothetical protein